MKFIDKLDEAIDMISKRPYAIHEMNTKVGGKEYDDFFRSMLKKWKIKSYKDLPKEKQKKFFDAVDKEWTSETEKNKDLKKKYRKGDDYRPGKDY